MTSYSRQITLQARNLGCDRSGVPIVRGVNIDVAPGEAVQLFGVNGSGKTSLLNLFAGHYRLAEGQIGWRIGDEEWETISPLNSVLYITHTPPMKSALTSLENLRFWTHSYGVPKANFEDTAYGALDRVGMMGHAMTRTGKLSAGQKRRLDIARAIIAGREVWLLDEPSAAIDSEGAEMVAAIISEHLGKGGIAIAATHDTLGVASKKLVIG